MITQELIDYVKTQLSSGVPREKITSDLLGQGVWTMEQINEVIQAAEQSTTSDSGILASDAGKENLWNKVIPAKNKTTAIVSSGLFLFLVFLFGGLSVFNEEIIGYFAQFMLKTLVGFWVFMLVENFVFRRSLKDRTYSGLDKWIMLLIGVRNAFVILSVIPFIQLIGAAVVFFGGIPWLLIYITLLFLRFRKLNSEAPTT